LILPQEKLKSSKGMGLSTLGTNLLELICLLSKDPEIFGSENQSKTKTIIVQSYFYCIHKANISHNAMQ